MKQMNIEASTGCSTAHTSSALIFQRKGDDRSSSRFSKSMTLIGSVIVLALQLMGGKANAVAIPTTSLTCTQPTTATTTCVNGLFASGWNTGTGMWTYEVNTVGYSGITMTFNTSSSGTGPTNGAVYYNTGATGATDQLISNYTVNTSCASKVITLPAACNGISNLKIKLKMTGASAAGGTNRVPSNGGFDGASAGCSGTPAAGSITASASSFCGSGSATLNLTGATSGSGVTYQWQSSTGGSAFANIAGATGLSYTTPVLTATTSYQVITTCGSLSSVSPVQTITINAVPSVSPISGVPASPLVIGGTVTLSDATAGGVFKSSNTNVATIDSVTGILNAVSGGTTTIRYTVGSGCTTTVTAVVNVVWPNTLALYAGTNGTSTGVIAIPGETTGTVTATNFGTPATACGTGGISGLTVPVGVTAYDSINAVPYVSYVITPNAGNALNVYRIHAVTRESTTGPAKARIAYRINGGAWISEHRDVTQSRGGSCGAASNSWDFTDEDGGLTINGITSNLEVAVFPYAPGASTGTFQLNSLEVYGYVSDDVTCSGLSNAGFVTPTLVNICDSGSRFLTYTGAVGVGISYQWQVSTDNVTFTDIAGANNASYNTGKLYAPTQNFYRVKVLCSAGGTNFSAADTVTVNSIPTPSFIFSPQYLHIGTAETLSGTPTGGWWSSNDTSSTSVDSASGIANGHIPGISIVTYHVTTGGCTGVARDTIRAIHDGTEAVYLGTGGRSVNVDFSGIDVLASDLVKSAGFDSSSSCGTGGISALVTNATSYSSSNPHVSFTVTPSLSSFGLDVTGISATVRRSGSGPAKYNMAYNLNGAGWIDGGQFNANQDDCGYSHTEEIFNTALLPVSLFSGDVLEIGLFPWNPTTPAAGTFQINSISVIGNGSSPLKPAPAAVANVNKSGAVQLYPNPASNVLNIVAAEKINVAVMSMDGKMLMMQQDAKQINVSNLANGLYIIKVYNQSNTLIQTAKFTKH